MRESVERIRQSVEVCRQIRNVHRDLATRDLGCPPEEIAGLTATLQTLLQEAAELDQAVPGFPPEIGSGHVAELLREKQRLLDEIAEQNRLLLPKFQGMMAVVSAELAELRSGRTALSGYRSGEPEKGERVRGAF